MGMNFKEIKKVLKKSGLNLNNKIIKGLELLLNKVDSSDTPKKGIFLATKFDSGFDLPEFILDKDGLAREMNFLFNFTELGEYFSVLNCDLGATSEASCDVQFLYQVGNTSFSAVTGISIEIDAEDGTYNVVIGEVGFSPYNTIYTEETDKEAIGDMIRSALESMDLSIILKSTVSKEFDFKVYFNGNEDLFLSDDKYMYGGVAIDILENINPLIFHILDNKLYIEFISTSEASFDIEIRKEDSHTTLPLASTSLSVEIDAETAERVIVVGGVAVNDEKYLKASDFIEHCIFETLSAIDINHLINVLNRYSNE